MSNPALEEPCCWICLGAAEEKSPLTQPCKCPRPVHLRCLAQWQLHSAGSTEESTCRFCCAVLPDWRCSLTPQVPQPQATVQPTVSVHFGGTEYRIRVSPTPEGMARFQRTIEVITGVPFSDAVSITFVCKVPQTEHNVQLQGMTNFDAAMHCAAISAAERHKREGTAATPPAATRAAAATGTRVPAPAAAVPAATGMRVPAAVPAAAVPAAVASPGFFPVTHAQRRAQHAARLALAGVSDTAGNSNNSSSSSTGCCPNAPPPSPAVPTAPRTPLPSSPRQLLRSCSPVSSDSGDADASTSATTTTSCSHSLHYSQSGPIKGSCQVGSCMAASDLAAGSSSTLGKRRCDPAWSRGVRGLWSKVVGL